MTEASQSSDPSASSAYPACSVSANVKSTCGDEAVLTYDELDEKEAIRSVADDGAGATVLFSGTTRDSFRGKQVTKLEYEAYTPLALKTLQALLEQAHTSAAFADHPIPRSANATPATDGCDEDRITRCYIAHRLGQVSVGECSILIAVSSPHRKEAFVVAEWLLEEVKKNVAVWKREFYASGEKVTALDGKVDEFDPKQHETEANDAVNFEARGGQSWSWKANFPST